MDALPTLAFPTLAAWETWLEENGGSSPGIWMKLSKAGAADPTLSKAEAIEGALAYGWIDGQIARLDDLHFLTRFTPRRPRSKWSANNCATAERLIEAGRMRAAGLREVERAKGDGRWESAYQPASRAEVPADLAAALAADSRALAMFERLDRTNRYAILYRVADAKRASTRAERIRRFVEMLARGETIHPPRKPRG